MDGLVADGRGWLAEGWWVVSGTSNSRAVEDSINQYRKYAELDEETMNTEDTL